MTEEVKRLAPTSKTLRELYLKSGNWCCYPGCTEYLMDQDGVFLGEVCHIEAASEDGPRFNSRQNNEDRRNFSNLILMCRKHHKIIDSEERKGDFPVDVLQKFKKNHEAKFTKYQEQMLRSFSDYSDLKSVVECQNLRQLNRALNWGHKNFELLTMVKDINGFAQRVRKIPPVYRKIYNLLLVRAYKHSFGLKTDINEVVESSPEMTADDMKKALPIFERYQLGYSNYDDDYMIPVFDFAKESAIGWCIPLDIKSFCDIKGINSSVMICDLNFSVLDD